MSASPVAISLLAFTLLGAEIIVIAVANILLYGSIGEFVCAPGRVPQSFRRGGQHLCLRQHRHLIWDEGVDAVEKRHHHLSRGTQAMYELLRH